MISEVSDTMISETSIMHLTKDTKTWLNISLKYPTTKYKS